MFVSLFAGVLACLFDRVELWFNNGSNGYVVKYYEYDMDWYCKSICERRK